MTNENLSKLEQIAKIASTVAVPIIIGIFGWLIQAENADKIERGSNQRLLNLLSEPVQSLFRLMNFCAKLTEKLRES